MSTDVFLGTIGETSLIYVIYGKTKSQITQMSICLFFIVKRQRGAGLQPFGIMCRAPTAYFITSSQSAAIGCHAVDSEHLEQLLFNPHWFLAIWSLFYWNAAAAVEGNSNCRHTILITYCLSKNSSKNMLGHKLKCLLSLPVITKKTIIKVSYFLLGSR